MRDRMEELQLMSPGSESSLNTSYLALLCVERRFSSLSNWGLCIWNDFRNSLDWISVHPTLMVTFLDVLGMFAVRRIGAELYSSSRTTPAWMDCRCLQLHVAELTMHQLTCQPATHSPVSTRSIVMPSRKGSHASAVVPLEECGNVICQT